MYTYAIIWNYKLLYSIGNIVSALKNILYIAYLDYDVMWRGSDVAYLCSMWVCPRKRSWASLKPLLRTTRRS